MTPAMTPEQVRVAVAEAMGYPKAPTRFRFGYKMIDHINGIRSGSIIYSQGWVTEDAAENEREKLSGQGYTCFAISKYRQAVEIPDYTNDLNAMAEAEKTLTSVIDRMNYAWNLRKITKTGWPFAVFATAEQRARAFLMVRNRA